MVRGGSISPQKKPEHYRPPDFKEVEALRIAVKEERQAVLDRIWEVKRARRNQWEETLNKLPAAFRKMPFILGEPGIPEMIQRVAGLVAKNEPIIQVTPPSGRKDDVRKAAKEEQRLNGLRITIEDQQDRATWGMAVDSQLAWGESWVGVYLDPEPYDDERLERGEDEEAGEYVSRHKAIMAEGGVPIRFVDHDPQTVFPIRGDKERLVAAIIQSKHKAYELASGYGYKAVRDDAGKVTDWRKITLGEPFVPNEGRGSFAYSSDTQHDTGTASRDSEPSGALVTKTIYLDCWTVRTFLDGKLVEEWEHGYGVVPLFPAYGKETSDRDPVWASQGIADVALTVARQMVFFSAILASNSMLNGFPTPFLRNPEHGLVHPVTGQPLTRAIKLGEMNLLGPEESLEFPLLDAKMGPDFLRAMEMLSGKLDSTTLASFNQAIDADVAGYAIAQVRSMQMAILGMVYKNAKRQWRKIGYFLRHIVKTDFPDGVFLRGAVEVTDDGEQYRPIMEYGAEHTTDFAIDVEIPEGIKQDEMAEKKMAIELFQAGLWSRRRSMEATGVADSVSENDEIADDRLLGSPAADQLVLQMAAEITANRVAAMQKTAQTGPFAEAIERAKSKYGMQAGMPQAQGAEPTNALPGGQPQQQNMAPAAPQQQNQAQPGAGPTLNKLGVPQLPGGVKGGMQVPAGAPG